MRTVLTMRALVVAACLGILSGCATAPPLPKDARFAAAELAVRAARSKSAPFDQRVANYLAAAAATGSASGTPAERDDAQRIYNIACAELTILLRSADGGRHWNQPLQVGAGSAAYQLRYTAGAARGAWSPDEFTRFV